MQMVRLVSGCTNQRSAKAQREFRGGAAAPVVEKNDCGLRAQHVVVNGDDVQLMSTKRLQYRGNFGFAHGDVTGNLRIGVTVISP